MPAHIDRVAWLDLGLACLQVWRQPAAHSEHVGRPAGTPVAGERHGGQPAVLAPGAATGQVSGLGGIAVPSCKQPALLLPQRTGVVARRHSPFCCRAKPGTRLRSGEWMPVFVVCLCTAFLGGATLMYGFRWRCRMCCRCPLRCRARRHLAADTLQQTSSRVLSSTCQVYITRTN